MIRGALSALSVSWFAFSAIAIAGCSGRGPVEELSPLLEGLGDPTRSVLGLSAELFRVLDGDSRAALEERAKWVSTKAGVTVGPAELIQARGVGRGARVSRVEIAEGGAERARLRVYFDAIVPSPPSGAVDGKPVSSAPEGAAIAPVEFDVTLEDGRWRLSLAELGKLVRSLGIEAAAAGGGG